VCTQGVLQHTRCPASQLTQSTGVIEAGAQESCDHGVENQQHAERMQSAQTSSAPSWNAAEYCSVKSKPAMPSPLPAAASNH
jgi:hypothetical protein